MLSHDAIYSMILDVVPYGQLHSHQRNRRPIIYQIEDGPMILAIPVHDDLIMWQIFRTMYPIHHTLSRYDLNRNGIIIAVKQSRKK